MQTSKITETKFITKDNNNPFNKFRNNIKSGNNVAFYVITDFFPRPKNNIIIFVNK